jgi:hypothetical protein
MIELILWIIGMLMLWAMINHGFRIANRIAIATETSALHTAALYNALTPEAKARIDLELARQAEQREAAARRNSKRRVDTASTF